MESSIASWADIRGTWAEAQRALVVLLESMGNPPHDARRCKDHFSGITRHGCEVAENRQCQIDVWWRQLEST